MIFLITADLKNNRRDCSSDSSSSDSNPQRNKEKLSKNLSRIMKEPIEFQNKGKEVNNRQKDNSPKLTRATQILNSLAQRGEEKKKINPKIIEKKM